MAIMPGREEVSKREEIYGKLLKNFLRLCEFRCFSLYVRKIELHHLSFHNYFKDNS